MENKTRLIDADALFKAIKSDKVAWRFGVPNTLGLLFDHLRIIIKLQPTVDAVEVVHAKWEHSPEIGDEVCSNCGFEWWDGCQECGVRPSNIFYCPNCGAKMDLEEKEDG